MIGNGWDDDSNGDPYLTWCGGDTQGDGGDGGDGDDVGVGVGDGVGDGDGGLKLIKRLDQSCYQTQCLSVWLPRSQE